MDGPNAISNGPPRDRVLWQYRTAAAEMRVANFDEARVLLDDALRTLQGIYGKDNDARRARGYFTAEEKKTFIGEPYERSMAYVYRGVIYWRDGELDNARACFRSAEFEDSDTVDRKYSGDWVLCDYLDGLATAKLAGDGSDAFKRAEASARNIKLPPYNLNANVLFIVEFGPGPTKYATGQYHEELRFQSPASQVLSARIQTQGLDLRVAPTDDLAFQATTRGGRVMDHVLANKAVFKSTTSGIGDAALLSGAILATQGGHNSAADEIGLGLMLAGLVSKLISASTTPRADIRSWDNLPRFISFATATLPPGEHTMTVDFLDASGNAVANQTKSLSVNIGPSDQNKLIFVSDHSSTPQNL